MKITSICGTDIKGCTYHMKYLIIGGGMIGMTYAWLLSGKNEVDILVKKQSAQSDTQGVELCVKDLCAASRRYLQNIFYPNFVSAIDSECDAVLLTLNRFQLQAILPQISLIKKRTKCIVFMQNCWDIRAEIKAFLDENDYIIIFLSNVGGGSERQKVEPILFDEPARIVPIRLNLEKML